MLSLIWKLFHLSLMMQSMAQIFLVDQSLHQAAESSSLLVNVLELSVCRFQSSFSVPQTTSFTDWTSMLCRLRLLRMPTENCGYPSAIKWVSRASSTQIPSICSWVVSAAHKWCGSESPSQRNSALLGWNSLIVPNVWSTIKTESITYLIMGTSFDELESFFSLQDCQLSVCEARGIECKHLRGRGSRVFRNPRAAMSLVCPEVCTWDSSSYYHSGLRV